jgi:hypothetical protein
MLAAAASSAFFPCENYASFWKEYILHIIVFKVEKGSFYSKMDSLAEFKKRMYLTKENHLY